MANLNKNKQGYGYKYTDLAEIHNYLESIDCAYIQKIERIGEDDYVMTKRIIRGEAEEEWIQGCRVVQATLSGIKNPAQEQGSALTYARRYSLLMAFGLATEDDDAASLTIKKEPEKTTPKATPKTTAPAKKDDTKINETQAKTLQDLVAETKTDEKVFLEYYKVNSYNEFDMTSFLHALETLNKRKMGGNK